MPDVTAEYRRVNLSSDPIYGYLRITKGGRGGVPGEVSEQELLRRCEEAKAKDPETRAVISADQSLNYGRVMRLIDTVKGQGIAKFALNIQKDAAPAPAAATP